MSSGSVGSNPLRDDRSVGDTLSVTSSDDIFYEDHHFGKDRFSKQKRRGSGLGGIATYFKSNIKGILAKEKGVPTQVSTDGGGDDDSNNTEKAKTAPVSERSPREFLDVMWRTRGYSRTLYNTLETGYFNRPTPLQVASYHDRILEMARKNQLTEMRALMAAGISPNPSKQNGDSLLHELSRLGNHDILGVLVNEFGADVQSSDDLGKTPLHEACFGGPDGPYFPVVDILAGKDRRMFSLLDASGKTPLDYIPLDHWGAWIDFLYVRRDIYWPRRLVRVDGPEEDPPLAEEAPDSRPLADPSAALTIDLAGLLVSGEITPEAVAACQKKDEDAEAISTDDSCSTSA